MRWELPPGIIARSLMLSSDIPLSPSRCQSSSPAFHFHSDINRLFFELLLHLHSFNMRPTIHFIASALLLPIALAQNTISSANTNSITGEAILSSGEVSLGEWADAYAKATALIAQLTNEEKITIITGGSVPSVNWTAVEFKDGTQGVQGAAST